MGWVASMQDTFHALHQLSEETQQVSQQMLDTENLLQISLSLFCQQKPIKSTNPWRVLPQIFFNLRFVQTCFQIIFSLFNYLRFVQLSSVCSIIFGLCNYFQFLQLSSVCEINFRLYNYHFQIILYSHLYISF